MSSCQHASRSILEFAEGYGIESRFILAETKKRADTDHNRPNMQIVFSELHAFHCLPYS